MEQIFINYSRRDTKSALKLYNDLRKRGKKFKPWIDQKDISIGINWEKEIWKAIRESDFFLAVLSSNSTTIKSVRRNEINTALQMLKKFPAKRSFLIPTRLNKCRVPIYKLTQLHYLDMFPKWKDGIDKLAGIIAKKKKSGRSKQKEFIPLQKYHFRVGLVDLDVGIPNLKNIAEDLNSVQSFFLFTYPPMPALKNVTKVYEGVKHFNMLKVPGKFIADHPNLSIDLMTCITRYPLYSEDDKYEYSNDFATPSDDDERFMFVSAFELYEFCKEAKCSFEKGLVYLIAGQLVTNFTTDLGYHKETRGCLLDRCDLRHDMVKGLRELKLCASCSKKIKNKQLKKAIGALLNCEL